MQLVIADTGPINYLILIGSIEILPALFEKLILPGMVRNELSHPKAPAPVRNWIANPPEWIEFGHVSNRNILGPEFPYLDPGEKEAIFLALEIQAELLLMDDEAGVSAARNQGLEVIGTLGILSRAADRKMLDLAEAFGRLKRTNFHHSQDVMDQFLTERE